MSAPSKVETIQDDVNNIGTLDKIWMVRPCEIYSLEFEECSSRKGRKHQMYIYGRHMDCSKWKEDQENCFKFRKDNDLEAAAEIIKHELNRREKRLAASKLNDIWEYRTGPPSDWDKPLTEWVKERERTSLSAVQKKLEEVGGDIEGLPKDRRTCVIS